MEQGKKKGMKYLWCAAMLCILLAGFGILKAARKNTPEAKLEQLLQNECHFVYQTSENHECFVTTNGTTKRYLEVTQTYKCSDCGKEIHPTEMHEMPMRRRSRRT